MTPTAAELESACAWLDEHNDHDQWRPLPFGPGVALAFRIIATARALGWAPPPVPEPITREDVQRVAEAVRMEWERSCDTAGGLVDVADDCAACDLAAIIQRCREAR